MTIWCWQPGPMRQVTQTCSSGSLAARGAGRSPAWAMLSMARPSQVAGRVVAILDGRRRRRAVSRRAGFLAAGLACAIVLPLGALELSAADRLPAVPTVDAASPVGSARPAARASRSGVITGSVTGLLPVSAPLAAQDAAPAQKTAPEQGDTRRRVAEALTTALQDDDADVRQEVLNALIDLRDPAAIPGLLTALQDPNMEARGRAVAGLARFDTPEAIEGLASALRDESPVVRARAALAFGNVRSTEAVTALLPLLDDADADVRRQAVRALGRIADPGAIDGLTGALQDSEPAVREEAARALGRVARGPEDAAGSASGSRGAPSKKPNGGTLPCDSPRGKLAWRQSSIAFGSSSAKARWRSSGPRSKRSSRRSGRSSAGGSSRWKNPSRRASGQLPGGSTGAVVTRRRPEGRPVPARRGMEPGGSARLWHRGSRWRLPPPSACTRLRRRRSAGDRAGPGWGRRSR